MGIDKGWMAGSTAMLLLRLLEEKGWITSYQGEGGGRTRKYYHLTEKGGRELKEKRAEWDRYTRAVSRVLEGGVCFG